VREPPRAAVQRANDPGSREFVSSATESPRQGAAVPWEGMADSYVGIRL
jgi:hypothetical protein